jgi:prolyl-tRNA synthetase
VRTADGAYTASLERAAVDPLERLELDGVGAVGEPEEVHTPNVGSIEAVCKFLRLHPQQMIKTLVYTAPSPYPLPSGERDSAGQVIVALLRGDHEANQAKLARAAGVAELALADEKTIVRTTGAAVGFAGPIGLLPKIARLVIDRAVAAMPAGVTGANKTDYHVRNVEPGRDFPLAGENVIVADIRNAVPGDTYQDKPLIFSHGIEVGHVFKLGTKYSEKLGATFLDAKGVQQPCIMGCYGIGVNRILAMAIESGHDDNGCILPAAIAPFEVMVLPINVDSPQVAQEAQRIHDELTAAGADVLLDDRDARAGVKFKDADLLGIPVRITVGERGLKEGKVEIKRRTEQAPTLIPAAEAVARARALVAEMKKG